MNPQEIIEAIKTIIKARIQNEPIVTLSLFDEIQDSVLQILRLMYQQLGNIDNATISNFYQTAVREYKSVYPIDIDPSSSLTKKGFHTWLTDERKKALATNYIDRYLRYLRNEGRSENVISEISRSSEAILGKLGDPQSSSSFYTKGLVVGSVQSGKTGNFNAVINRAVDAGYNLVIILSGIMEDLRSQTQLRLELDVIGDGVINLHTEQHGAKGVGKVVGFGVQNNSEIPQVISITSHKSDFKKQVQDASFSLNHKNILVCKKNTGVLKNLLIWLSDYLSENTDQHNIPLLIIDDEADNASLNNLGHKGREYSSIINGHIRAILALFSKKTYLGYTATPFANVLQDRNEEAEDMWTISYKRNGESISKNFRQVNNIFPDDFIELLESPTNYIGAKQIFDTTTNPDAQKIPLIEPVTDYADSFPIKVINGEDGLRAATLQEIKDNTSGLRSPQRDDGFPFHLPESLNDAIKCFVLGIAIRLKRKTAMMGSKLYMPHHTMLIHISRFTDWQNRTRNLVAEDVNTLLERVGNEIPSSANSIYSEFERIWNNYYAAIVENIRTYLPDGYIDEFLAPVTFEEIKPLLPEAIKGIEVKAINSFTKEKLVYSTDASGNGKKYIAIGGNRLSRGFTLEGLTINYFIRDTNYADTLLQMGRWFGYRPGYIDCCKLFTTWDAIEKFNAATRTIEELEIEFKKMHREGKTPQDFILRVRTHPGVLKITRPSILKNTEEVNWSYQDTLVQTTQFDMNATRINNAWEEMKALFRHYQGTINPFRNSTFYLLETDHNGLFQFLDCANTFHNFSDELKQIKAFIDIAVSQGKLTNWRIAIKATGASEREIKKEDSYLPGNVKLTKRSGPPEEKAHYRKELTQQSIFTGSGKSANLLSGGLDMAVWLDEKEIQHAEQEFISEQTKYLIDEKKLEEDIAVQEARRKTKPERIYREKMSDKMGLLVIYLMDINAIYNDEELKRIKADNKIDGDVPLIGYAIGFPVISAPVGGVYVRGKYNIEEDEPIIEELDEEMINAMEDTL
ncbi:Z1 domain-containing protein [Chitinophagaceae bacterium MMS25-I14]